MDKIKIFALGGLDQNGKDCYIIEINDDIFVVEAGNLISDKTVPGVDCVLPNYSYLINNKSRIKGYFITHGHDQAMSSLKFFYNKAPAKIYCTYQTSCSIQGQAQITEMNVSSFEYELVNASQKLNINGHEIQLFQMAHNFPNTFGIAFKTDRGNIIFSSDFIIDFSCKDPHYAFDIKTLSALGKEKTLLLMVGSNAANFDGYCSPRHTVINYIEKYFQYNQRIFVTCFWQNVFRLNEIAELCVKHNKKMVFYDKYTEIVMASILSADTGYYLNRDVLNIIPKEDMIKYNPNDLVILMLGYSKDIYTDMISLARGKDPDTRVKLTSSDIFLNCAGAPLVCETLSTKANDEVAKTGATYYWLTRKNVSLMHARKDDIKALIDILRPQYLMPVRGTYANLLTTAKLSLDMKVGLNYSNVFVLDNGMQVSFSPTSERPNILLNSNGEIDVSPILVDGMGLSKNYGPIIQERNKIGMDGIVIVSGSVDIKNSQILSKIDVNAKGYAEIKPNDPIVGALSKIFENEVKEHLFNGESIEDTTALIAEKCLACVKKDSNRTPLILPIISIL